MLRAVLVVLVLGVALPMAVGGQTLRTCQGLNSAQFDQWCQENCNHNIANCPANLCLCTGDTPPPTVQCQAVGLFGLIPGGNVWCSQVCTAEFCPQAFCDCGFSQGPAVAAGSLISHDSDSECCQGTNQDLYIGAHGGVFRVEADVVTEQTVELCHAFPGGSPNDLVIADTDTRGVAQIYVADPVLGTVSRISTECDGSIDLITSWSIDGVIDQPTALTISDGNLFVSGSRGIFIITFDINGDVADIERTTVTPFDVASMSTSPDGLIYVVERNAAIFILDPANGFARTPYLLVHQHDIPDIKGVLATECGVYLSATDSNQVFFCPDLQDATTCDVYCELSDGDANSCFGINNPWQIASGCCCDVYVGNPGNGKVVRYENKLQSDGGFAPPLVGNVIASGVNFPNAVAVHVRFGGDLSACTDICNGTAAPTESSTPTPSQSASPSATPSSTPTATASASASAAPSGPPSSTPSSTPTPSVTAIASASPSVSATASASASASPSTSTTPTLAGLILEAPLQTTSGGNGQLADENFGLQIQLQLQIFDDQGDALDQELYHIPLTQLTGVGLPFSEQVVHTGDNVPFGVGPCIVEEFLAFEDPARIPNFDVEGRPVLNPDNSTEFRTNAPGTSLAQKADFFEVVFGNCRSNAIATGFEDRFQVVLPGNSHGERNVDIGTLDFICSRSETFTILFTTGSIPDNTNVNYIIGLHLNQNLGNQKICYDTSLGESVHGLAGQDNIICLVDVLDQQGADFRNSIHRSLSNTTFNAGDAVSSNAGGLSRGCDMNQRVQDCPVAANRLCPSDYFTTPLVPRT